MLNCDTFVFKQEDQSIEWMTKKNKLWRAKGKYSSGTKDSYLDSNRLSCEKKLGPLHLALVGLTGRLAGRQAGWLAGRQAGRRNTARFRNLENPLQVKLFGFLLCL